MAISQYEHIDPPYAKATTHDPEKIALLCGSCHDRITRGMWSKEKVIEARLAPITFVKGYARDAFDFKVPFELFIGDNCLTDIRCIVRKSTGEEWFSIEPPEAVGAPPRLNVKFFGLDGQPELEIYQNEWKCTTGVWDLEVRGPVIEIRIAPRKVMLRLRSKPPHGLELRYLDMIFQGTGILVDEYGTVTLSMAGTQIQMKGTEVASSDAVFNLP